MMRIWILLVAVLFTACAAPDQTNEQVQELEKRLKALEQENETLKQENVLTNSSSSARSSMPAPLSRTPSALSSSPVTDKLCSFSDWSCDEYLPCSGNGTRERRCVLINNTCKNPDDVKPLVQQSCTPSAIPEANTTAKRLCTAEDWVCREWEPCTAGIEKRSCVIGNPKCLDPESVKPETEKSCLSYMEKKLLAWKKVHEEMVQAGKELIQQDASYSVVKQLGAIESEFVVRYNEYLNYSHASGDNHIVLKEIEKSINKLIDDYRALPKVTY